MVEGLMNDSSYPVKWTCVQANWARWEPGHGRFKFRHPWNQYLKIGALARQCAYEIATLQGYVCSDDQVRCCDTIDFIRLNKFFEISKMKTRSITYCYDQVKWKEKRRETIGC